MHPAHLKQIPPSGKIRVSGDLPSQGTFPLHTDTPGKELSAITDAEKKPCCCATEPAEKDTAPSCCRHKDRTPEEYRALANRLSRIEGQVRGIRAMLDKDVYCADILVQVAAVNAALNGFSKELLGQHIRTCVADDLKAGETQKLDELLQLLPRLMK